MASALRKVVLAGGSGFLGQLLAHWFANRHWQVVVLTRQHLPAVGPARVAGWNGRTLGSWARELDGSQAVINLAGVSVNCRYHARNRRAILASRLDSTRVIGEAIQACQYPPAVWLNSSTATIYKHSLARPMDEQTGIIEGTPAAKDQFSVDVAKAWEQAFTEAATPHTRKVAMRTAMVFGAQPGTVYRVLRRLVRLGLGGAMGHGDQFVSWIHEDDFCRAVAFLIEHADLDGPVNLAAPHPLTNREMMQCLRYTLGMPVGLPARRWMLELGAFALRTETELIIKSRRVVPGRLSAAGFRFDFPDLTSAVLDLERRLARTKQGERQAAC